MFRNLTCTLIDAENNWCNIRRFYYVSPSPVVMNNLLVINFFVVDSTENDCKHKICVTQKLYMDLCF